MKIDFKIETILEVHSTSEFKRQLKKLYKQGKDINKLRQVIEKLANKEKLDEKYQNHMLNDSKKYKNCGECYIEPDWLLVYQYVDNELVLLLVTTGSHSEIF